MEYEDNNGVYNLIIRDTEGRILFDEKGLSDYLKIRYKVIRYIKQKINKILSILTNN